jgi:hypothetical protein
MAPSHFPMSKSLTKLYLGLGIAFAGVSALSLTYSAQRDLVSFALQLPLVLMFAFGLYGQLPTGYSVEEKKIVVKKMLFKQVIPISRIIHVELRSGEPTFFERFFGCRYLDIRLEGADSIVIYSSESEALLRTLQQSISQKNEC